MFKFFKTINKEDKEISKSSDKIKFGLSSLVFGKKLTQDILDDIEDVLLTSDIGVKITNDVITFLKENRFNKETDLNDIKNIVYQKLLKSFENISSSYIDFNHKPYVILFLGVNGCGKTTIIGKFANQMKFDGRKVLLVACDTFRAGAVEQLKIWNERAKTDIFLPERINEDPSSVAYKAYNKAKNENYDVLLVDTAGRLQNNANLMSELKKIKNTLGKFDTNIPNKTILVLDATTGQNSIKQCEEFNKQINIDGIVMNKMDGSSKGGILISIADNFKKPIFAIGVGEKIDDIKNFNAEEFLKNLLGLYE